MINQFLHHNPSSVFNVQWLHIIHSLIYCNANKEIYIWKLFY